MSTKGCLRPTTPPPDAMRLCETERSRLQTFIQCGHASARTHTRAQVPLKLAAGWSEAEGVDAFAV